MEWLYIMWVDDIWMIVLNVQELNHKFWLWFKTLELSQITLYIHVKVNMVSTSTTA